MLPRSDVSNIPYSKLISLEKPKFVPSAPRYACLGLSPCEERELYSLDISDFGNRPGPLMNSDPEFADHERLDSAFNTDNIVYICRL